MREIFQRHLRPLGEETYQVRECRISRAHYLKATSRILRYTLHLEESATGRERIALLTGVMYAEGSRARREWQELQRLEPGRAIPYALLTFEPFFFIPELEMLVQVFPYDHQLPSLPILMAGPPPTLEPLVLARFGEGDRRTEAWDVEPVRHRTGARMTLRLRVRVRNRTTGQLEEKCFYAKVRRRGRPRSSSCAAPLHQLSSFSDLLNRHTSSHDDSRTKLMASCSRSRRCPPSAGKSERGRRPDTLPLR
jgi:hypothetical protein